MLDTSEGVSDCFASEKNERVALDVSGSFTPVADSNAARFEPLGLSVSSCARESCSPLLYMRTISSALVEGVAACVTVSCTAAFGSVSA